MTDPTIPVPTIRVPTIRECPTCGGLGKTRWKDARPYGEGEDGWKWPCLTCSGTGRVVGVPTDGIMLTRGEQVRVFPAMKPWDTMGALWPGEDNSRGCMITRSDEIGILRRKCERGPAAVVNLIMPGEAPEELTEADWKQKQREEEAQDLIDSQTDWGGTEEEAPDGKA